MAKPRAPSSTTANSARRQRGFTLMEVMITVAIVGILAAIAYPAYTGYIRKGKRATAQAALVDLASREQTYLLDRRAYTATLSDLSFAAPTEIANDYDFTVVTGAAPSFTATATPKGRQAGSGEQSLTVSDTGAKTPANTTGYWGK